ncbi:MAG: hypothetical protein ACXWR0_06690, partial [Bdellovibrio sp.]
SVYQFISLSVYQFISLSVYQFISLSVYQFISLSVYQFISLSVYKVDKVDHPVLKNCRRDLVFNILTENSSSYILQILG